jgi:EAL domain-containing protein (putative c-di-GMP-specific phosphodiesterase class I)
MVHSSLTDPNGTEGSGPTGSQGVRLTTRILVVDDDTNLLRSVERTLVRAGFEAVCACDVREALRFATRMHMDAALVDYDLTNETGLQVLARLRKVHPSCLRILMTGSDDFPMVVEAVNRGEVLRVIRKPFEAGGLLATLRDAFASRDLMVEAASSQLKRRVDDQYAEWFSECINSDRHLQLALQPILRADNGKHVAYEALLRSNHSILDSPLAILRIAERYNGINDLGRAIFRHAKARLGQIPPGRELFVNLHPAQLGDPERLHQDLTPLIPFADRVTLEITERSRLSDLDHWEASVELLGAEGFSLAIDDLGAGYNSLSMLADLQPRYIKLDMALVRHIHREPRKQRLVQLMVTFAEATEAIAIAEGVETEEEAKCLIDCGIHLMQGYYYAPPTTDVAALIAEGASVSGDMECPQSA